MGSLPERRTLYVPRSRAIESLKHTFSQDGGDRSLLPLVSLTPLLALGGDPITALLLCGLQGVLLAVGLVVRAVCAKIEPAPYRLLVTFFLLACVVSGAERLLAAYHYGLFERLGVYLPLLAASSLLVTYEQEAGSGIGAKRNLRAWATYSGLAVTFGFVRELLGEGKFLGQFHLLTFDYASTPVLDLHFQPLRVVSTPAGALITIALILALAQCIYRNKSHADDRPNSERITPDA
ncbi:MAG: Rnf-Nqr domain containing protein [Pseudomonadota bacterium]